MKSNEHKISLNVLYRRPLDSVPVLKKEQENNKDALQPSKIEVEDPGQQFPKTYLGLYGTGKKLIGRFASENGLKDDHFFSLQTDDVNINDAEITDILLTETGSLWKLKPGHISFSTAGDASDKSFPLTGMKILPAGGDAVWVAGPGRAWLLDKGMQNVKSYPWQGGINSIASGESLCAISKSRDKIFFLDRNGGESSKELNTTLGFFENLIAFSNGKYITLEGSTFKIYDLQHLICEIPLQSLGILDNGEIFYSYTKNNTTWFISPTATREFKLPADYSNYILPVIGQRSGNYVGYHLGVMGEFNEKDGILRSLTRINEKKYKELIYPVRWKIAQRNFYSVIDPFNIIVSITGPEEVVLIEIRAVNESK